MIKDRLLWKLSIASGTFAITAAMLIGIGQSSLSIPVLVLGCVICSWVYTDWLGWVRLHRYFVYLMMITGAAFAIFDYLNQESHGQLYSVANLLVYAQLPLLFQEKSRRIFEQIGIFLLLELVVAALVNDNVIYGILLIPTLTIGAWVLVLYATYITYSSQGTKTIRPWSWRLLIEEVSLLGRPRTIPVPSPLSVRNADKGQTKPRWIEIGLPLSASLIFFSGTYFYAIPRLSRGAYGATGLGQATVGFNDEVLLSQMGKILQSHSAVFRLELQRGNGKLPYRPLEPPYIRGAALHLYKVDRGNGGWYQGDYSRLSLSKQTLPPLPHAAFLPENEHTIATISEQAYVGDLAFCIPPCYQFRQAPEVDFDPDVWQFSSDRTSVNGQATRREYSFLTQGFVNGVQTPWVPESEAVFTQFEEVAVDDRQPAPYDELSKTQYALLTYWSASRFAGTVRYRDKLLALQRDSGKNLVDQCLLLRDHLANSGEFSYTLDLSMNRDRLLDPIEDFVVNQKRGHCQFFASALAVMLRSMGVPARLVVGYRPAEYNEVGKYFLVRQSHAHAWVEAYFTREQCNASSLVKLPDNFAKGGWYRLDATPPGNGSNSGRSLSQPNSQTLDFAQQLWRDYIMNIDRSSHTSPVQSISDFSSGSYAEMLEKLQESIDQFLERSQESIFPSRAGIWWQVVLVGAIAAAIAFVAWKTLGRLLRFGGGTPKRKSHRKHPKIVTQEFFRRLVRIMESEGWKRHPSQTHREFALQCLEKVRAQRGIEPSDFPIAILTDRYYAMRYGSRTEWTTGEWQEILIALNKVEATLRSHPLPRKLR